MKRMAHERYTTSGHHFDHYDPFAVAVASRAALPGVWVLPTLRTRVALPGMGSCSVSRVGVAQYDFVSTTSAVVVTG